MCHGSSVGERLSITKRSPISWRYWLRSSVATVIATSTCIREAAGSNPARDVGQIPEKRGCSVVAHHDKISAVARSRVSVA